MTPPTRRSILTAGGLALATIPLGGLTAAQAAARPKPAAAATLDVISDVQGDLADLGRALDNLAALGRSDALVIAGDLVAQGTVQQYEDLYGTLAGHSHPDRVLAALGNHEQYNSDPFDTQVKRFLQYTGMPDVYSQTTAAGLPLPFIGTTAPANRDDWAAKKVVEGGDPAGFTVVNTGFIQTIARTAAAARRRSPAPSRRASGSWSAPAANSPSSHGTSGGTS